MGAGSGGQAIDVAPEISKPSTDHGSRLLESHRVDRRCVEGGQFSEQPHCFSACSTRARPQLRRESAAVLFPATALIRPYRSSSGMAFPP